MSVNRSSKLVIACGIGLLVLFMATEPKSLPGPVLVIPFVLICTPLLTLFVGLFRWRGMAAGKSLRLGLMATALPMLILILQTLGQLTIRDLLTILTLFTITHFYLSRITGRQSE